LYFPDHERIDGYNFGDFCERVIQDIMRSCGGYQRGPFEKYLFNTLIELRNLVVVINSLSS